MLTAVAACQTPPPATPTFSPPPTTSLQTLTPVGYPAPATPAPSDTPANYPAVSVTPINYPAPATATSAPPSLTPPPPAYPASLAYIPFSPHQYTPPLPTETPTLTPLPTATPTETPTPTPTIDFTAVRAQLNANGQDLGFAKIGFHTGLGGHSTGLDVWMQTLDTAGVPFFLKSVDDAGPLLLGQTLSQASGVPHTLVYRSTGPDMDVPNYALPPEQAALEHWQKHVARFPPELDPSLVWMETINEVDKNQAEWLAQFALATAQLALADGRRWAAFGWAAGEPEPQDWQTPAMLQFLQLVADHPDQLAIALHEYSYNPNDIRDGYPYKIGRFLELYRICDAHGIPRPTILITEWGWAYQEVPTPDRALQDIAWASALYAPYPQVKGAAIWYLGGGFADIASQAEKLIPPSLNYNLGHYFPIPLPPNQAPTTPP